jgi:UDP:flavonoid glycosyltransferase YjiC (YdhE family)
VVVGHGGHATTMTALAHDLPLVVLPLHPMLDQKMVGAAVAKAGAARLLTKNASAAQVAAAITELLADGPHRTAAARLGAQVRASSAASRAAGVLESLIVRS